MTDNITPLRPVAEAAPQPRDYLVTLKIGDGTKTFGPITGYLVTNGYIACILDEFENANSVTFLANQGDVAYIEESFEVLDEEAPF